MSGPPRVYWRDRLRARSEWQGDCLVDTSAQRNKKYARIGIGHGTEYRATRLILEERLGRPLAPGEIARHTCHNPPCWNDEHILIGTQVNNMADMVEAGRQRSRAESCPHGHPWTPETTYINPKGLWICKVCRRETDRRRREHG
jgi:hypothetical protein